MQNALAAKVCNDFFFFKLQANNDTQVGVAPHSQRVI